MTGACRRHLRPTPDLSIGGAPSTIIAVTGKPNAGLFDSISSLAAPAATPGPADLATYSTNKGLITPYRPAISKNQAKAATSNHFDQKFSETPSAIGNKIFYTEILGVKRPFWHYRQSRGDWPGAFYPSGEGQRLAQGANPTRL